MHHTTKGFWKWYYQLPKEVKELADKNFYLLKKNKNHPSLQFKKIEELYSVRIGLHYRALGIEKNCKIFWFWIGHHDEYMRIIRGY
jgi:hypothetical protein